MGCPGAKLAQGSSCHSHDPCLKSSESYPSDFKTGESVCKQFRSRYVCSAHCNSSAVESLLAMSKRKAFTVFCSKVKSIPSGVPYLCCSNDNSLNSAGITAVTANRSYPRSYAQVVKSYCQDDTKTSSNEVKGYESKVEINSCESSGNRHSCVQVMDKLANTLKKVTCGTVEAIHHNCRKKGTAKVIVVGNHDVKSTALCLKNPENGAIEVVQPQEVRVQTSERSYSREVSTPLQSQVVHNDPTVAQNSGHPTMGVPHAADSNSSPVLTQSSTQSPIRHDNRGLDSGRHYNIFDINGLDEKYLASILIQTPKKKLWRHSDNRMVKAWRDQTDFEFGFILLSDLQGADTNVVNHVDHYCPIEAHKVVASHHKPNYLGARIRVDTQLNLQEWYDQPKDYCDQQLLDFLTFGFPLDFNRKSPLKWEGDNHKSAVDYPNDIEAYLQEELDFKAVVGLFAKHPCKDGHISLFMTREKPGSKHRRVIIDLSWPLGCLVNAGIDKSSYMGTDFVLVLPTVDHITDQLKALGKGAHLYKIDISRAFRHIKVDPLDYDLLGLHWRDVYVDTCVPFGSRHGSQIFQRVSDAVRHIMRRHGHKFINYVDDYIGFGVPSNATASFDLLFDLLQKLGLTVSQKKLVPPTTSVVCLGVEINTLSGTVSIPAEKLRQISDTVKEWKHRKTCTKRQRQSLLGHLLYIHKCGRPARFFLNRVLQTFRSGHIHSRITLDPEFLGGLIDFCPYIMGCRSMITKNVITKFTWTPVCKV